MNILIVDDEPAIVKMCEKVLADQGHTVQGFTRPREALAYLAAGPAADLLVVDYQMPEHNGFEFIQRAWDLQPKLRVVMITAHGSRELLGQVAETGVHGLVLKPFTAAELMQGVKKALAR